MLSSHDRKKLEQRLKDRESELRTDIVRELQKSDNETYVQLAGRVSDSGEQSVADLLMDVNLAEISRDIEEFREIEAALLRVAGGVYGLCVDCDGSIEAERLAANAAAARCRRCQQAFETRDRQTHHRSL